jgi:hypothetical protein
MTSVKQENWNRISSSAPHERVRKAQKDLLGNISYADLLKGSEKKKYFMTRVLPQAARVKS